MEWGGVDPPKLEPLRRNTFYHSYHSRERRKRPLHREREREREKWREREAEILLLKKDSAANKTVSRKKKKKRNGKWPQYPGGNKRGLFFFTRIRPHSPPLFLYNKLCYT